METGASSAIRVWGRTATRTANSRQGQDDYTIGFWAGYDAAQILDANISASAGQQRPSRYRSVKVLTLCWENHDLEYRRASTAHPASIDDELRRVTAAFRSYKYDVEHYDIPETRSTARLVARLRSLAAHASDDKLIIIYYNGHGSLAEPLKGLALEG